MIWALWLLLAVLAHGRLRQEDKIAMSSKSVWDKERGHIGETEALKGKRLRE